MKNEITRRWEVLRGPVWFAGLTVLDFFLLGVAAFGALMLARGAARRRRKQQAN